VSTSSLHASRCEQVPAGGHLLTFCFGPNRFFEPGAALLSSELLAHSLDGAGSVGPDGAAGLRPRRRGEDASTTRPRRVLL